MKLDPGSKYHEEHEWVRVEGDEAVIGISDYAQEQLSDIVYVELQDPYGEAWFARIGIADLSELDGLMDAEAYQAYVESLDE
jgi:glycine cleavage system H lipoate-binding protein